MQPNMAMGRSPNLPLRTGHNLPTCIMIHEDGHLMSAVANLRGVQIVVGVFCLRLLLGVLVFTGFPMMTWGDDYPLFERGLANSSVELNRLRFPDLIYRIDERTAEQYFQRYFSKHVFTEALRMNINYPLFHWGDNHDVLQRALANVLLNQLAEFFALYTGPSEINAVLQANNQLHDQIFYSLGLIVDILLADDVDEARKSGIRERVRQLLVSSRLGEPSFARIDKDAFPFVNSIKVQLLLTCFVSEAQVGRLREFSRSLGLIGARKRLLEEANLLLLDNGAFNETDLRFIESFMASLPRQIHFPVAATCFDALISSKNKRISVFSFRSGWTVPWSSANFNLFDSHVGAGAEKLFPEEYAKPVLTDNFATVFAHEFTHCVDGLYVATTPSLSRFRDQVLRSAGSDHNNYVRSMFEDGFFQKYKQEFVASLACQYFSSSEDLLFHSLEKAKKGNLNHINQFILMASIFNEADKAFFYRIDEKGAVRVNPVPVEKNDGLITRFTYRGTRFRFHYSEGLIDRIVSAPNPSEPQATTRE